MEVEDVLEPFTGTASGSTHHPPPFAFPSLCLHATAHHDARVTLHGRSTPFAASRTPLAWLDAAAALGGGGGALGSGGAGVGGGPHVMLSLNL